jgi:hypothetical protein
MEARKKNGEALMPGLYQGAHKGQPHCIISKYDLFRNRIKAKSDSAWNEVARLRIGDTGLEYPLEAKLHALFDPTQKNIYIHEIKEAAEAYVSFVRCMLCP